MTMINDPGGPLAKGVDAVKRRRVLRYLMLFTVLTLTAVLVTIVMFRALTFVFS